MSSHIDQLATGFGEHISVAWPEGSSGAQRVVMVVYSPVDEKLLRRRLPLFEEQAVAHKHTWLMIDITRTISEWLAQQKYREAYFEQPDDLVSASGERVAYFLADKIGAALKNAADRNSIVAVIGVPSVFSYSNFSNIIAKIENQIVGRLVVFFPGTAGNSRYRLLNARENWDYHAVAISVGEMGAR